MACMVPWFVIHVSNQKNSKGKTLVPLPETIMKTNETDDPSESAAPWLLGKNNKGAVRYK